MDLDTSFQSVFYSFQPGYIFCSMEFFTVTLHQKHQGVNFSRFLNQWFTEIWMFPKIGVPQNGWFIIENPQKTGMNLGVPRLSETSKMVQKIDRGCHRRKGIGIFVLEGGRDCTNPSRILAARPMDSKMPCLRRPRFFFAQVERFRGLLKMRFPQKRLEPKNGGCLRS